LILVVGATGLLGREVCRRLLDNGDPLRALARPGSSYQRELAVGGAEIEHGDLKDRPAIEVACRGVRTVVSTATATASYRKGDSLRAVDLHGQLDLVRSAAAAGVERFIYVSISPNLPGSCALVHYKRQVENALRESGMAWTILQPGAFMEIWLGPLVGWDIEKGRARIIGGGEAQVSYVSLQDVAAFAVAATHDDSMSRQTIPVGAPQPTSPNEVLRICEETTGRPFKVQRLPAAPFRLGARVLRPFNERIHTLLALTAAIAEGDVLDMLPVQEAFRIPLTSVAGFAREAVHR